MNIKELASGLNAKNIIERAIFSELARSIALSLSFSVPPHSGPCPTCSQSPRTLILTSREPCCLPIGAAPFSPPLPEILTNPVRGPASLTRCGWWTAPPAPTARK